jgi:predicted nucleotidyltransferase
VQKSVKMALDTYVNYISSLEGVEQIYLFGSHAYGTPHEHSDIDLMVVIEDSLNTSKTAVKISKGLIGQRLVPLDILVNRRGEFYKAANEATIQNQIKNEGVLLYAK